MVRFLVTSVILLATITASSQSRFYIGPKLGYHGSSSYIEHTVYTLNFEPKIITGFHGGVMARHFAVWKKGRINTGIQLGVEYNERGWKQDFLNTDPVTTRLNYFTFPVESILYLGNPRNRFYGLMGFYLDFLTNYTAGESPPDEDLVGEQFFTFDPDRDKRFGYGLKGSIGLQKKTGYGDLMIEGFFSYSISNFIEIESRASGDPDISNLWAVGASIGYLIPIGK